MKKIKVRDLQDFINANPNLPEWDGQLFIRNKLVKNDKELTFYTLLKTQTAFEIHFGEKVVEVKATPTTLSILDKKYDQKWQEFLCDRYTDYPEYLREETNKKMGRIADDLIDCEKSLLLC